MGEPYPESYIRFWHSSGCCSECRVDRLRGSSTSCQIEGLSVPDYSTLDRRTNGLDIRLDETLIKSGSLVTIAVDGLRIKVHNTGDWIRYVWKVKK